jgi:YbbR domain-containing protein
VAEGLTLGPSQVEPSTVTLRGASSRIGQVSQVVARVSIDASALNVDREVELIAVDGNGNQVSNVEIDPERARVRIAVARELANRTLPIVPTLTGTPAPGYRISTITVEPLIVTVSGEEATVTRLESAPTEPIDIEGRSTDLEAIIGLDLPPGVSVNGSDDVRVMLTIEQDIGTRTFVVGFQLVGSQCACIYSYDKQAITVVLGGPILALQGVDDLNLAADLNITGLVPGSHSVTVVMTPPDGLELVAISPEVVNVTIEAATPVPGPT